MQNRGKNTADASFRLLVLAVASVIPALVLLYLLELSDRLEERIAQEEEP